MNISNIIKDENYIIATIEIPIDIAIINSDLLDPEFAIKFCSELQQKLRESLGYDGYVICIDNSDYPGSLRIGEKYKVVKDGYIPNDLIKIIDDTDESYLFPINIFNYIFKD